MSRKEVTLTFIPMQKTIKVFVKNVEELVFIIGDRWKQLAAFSQLSYGKIWVDYEDLEDVELTSDSFTWKNLPSRVETSIVSTVKMLMFSGIGGPGTTKEVYTTAVIRSKSSYGEIVETLFQGLTIKPYDYVIVRKESYKKPLAVAIKDVLGFFKCLYRLPSSSYSIASEPLKFFVCYALPRHQSYSHIVFPQVAEKVNFPELPALTADPFDHYSKLTWRNGNELKAVINQLSAIENIEEVTALAVQMLQIISNNAAPKSEFPEKTRRSVIDIFVHLALHHINTKKNMKGKLSMEESMLKKPFPDTIGHGPFDYYSVPEGVVVSVTNQDESCKGGEDLQDVDEEEQWQSVARDLSLVSTEGLLLVGVDDCVSSFMDIDTFLDIEAKVSWQDQALYQLLAQMHDSLYFGLQDDDRTIEHLSVSRQKAIGILSTGHSWEVYSIKVNKSTGLQDVRYLGKEVVKVLRYVSTTRTSSFTVADASTETEIDEAEVRRVLLMLIAVFDGRI
jgi:hypothetical protein